MNRWKNVIIFGLAALVAGAVVLVYVRDGQEAGAQQAGVEAGQEAAGDRLPEPAAKAADGSDGGEVLHDMGALPDSVQRMLRQIILAAQTGEISEMRPVLESNELKPMVAAAHVDDPIAYWKEQSVDGTGRDVLGAMLNILSSGFVLSGKGHDAIYVWPSFAEADLTKLTPSQQVELYRIVPPNQAKAMLKKGTYGYYKLGISPSGVWHYFLQ
jgi:hypothetical protein